MSDEDRKRLGATWVHGDPMCADCHRERDGGDPLTREDAQAMRARCSVSLLKKFGDLEDF